MKNLRFILIILIISFVGLFAFKDPLGSVKGVIIPADGAVRAWALSSTDTFRASVAQGVFEIAGVKPGVYRIIIEATPPYKNMARDSVQISEGAATDAGTFALTK